ncbi:cell cycle checkpoint control protein RAD9A [Drosophila albomicans]|uniref:Cell cycle checkpoint control protein n=1 Tax=Drosophila albomicans TaxID=7291 RepID=A0A6P8WVP4_DROAB|nr:cell cycle checkpoint control protein RAD9A [Drosophila albomicans]
MKCTLEGSNARVLAKAIQSLSKVGKELFIEADGQGLQMRTINATQSAVGSIRFSRAMFDTFQMPPSGDCYCKIAMKSCLGVFRNMKQVEHCELSVVNNSTKFQVKLRCKLETTKQALLSIVDEQNITSAVPTDQSVNCIRGDFKLFMEISNSFIASEEELTLEAKPDSLSAKNYIEGARVNDKFMRSQLKLKPSEFSHYQVAQEAVITFCIKEFRAFLLFAEALNAEMSIEFDDAGSPFLLKIKKHAEIECILILSTLSPDDVSFSEDYCQREIREADLPSVAQKRKSSTPGPTVQQKRRLAENTTVISDEDASVFQFREHRPPRPSEAPSVQPARLLADGDTVDVVEEEADEEALLLAVSEAAQASQAYPPNSTEVYFFETEEAPPTVLPPEKINDAEEEDESIPQSPEREQRHKLRTIFSRCFQNTYVPREPSPNSQVYAPNSDTED